MSTHEQDRRERLGAILPSVIRQLERVRTNLQGRKTDIIAGEFAWCESFVDRKIGHLGAEIQHGRELLADEHSEWEALRDRLKAAAIIFHECVAQLKDSKERLAMIFECYQAPSEGEPWDNLNEIEQFVLEDEPEILRILQES